MNTETVVDWSGTLLGQLEQWPELLRALFEMHRNSQVPTCIFWGSDSVILPNTAWEREVSYRSLRMAGLAANNLSYALGKACNDVLAGGTTDCLIDALLPITWRALVDRPFAGLFCSVIRGSDAEVLGFQVQLGIALGGTASTEGAGDTATRSSFMLRLSDAMRQLNDADAAQTLGTQMLGEYLGADFASFTEVDFDTGEASERLEYIKSPTAHPKAADHKLVTNSSALQLLRNGLPLIMDNIGASLGNSTDPTPGASPEYSKALFRAQLTVPVLRSGRIVSVITILHDCPHRWTVAEVTTAQDASIRIWEAIERARAEATMRESERRFRALVNASHQIFYRMSSDWKQLRQLRGAGILPDAVEMSAKWLADYIDLADQPRLLATVRKAIKTRQPFELEHRIKRSDGTLGWLWSRVVPLLDCNNEVEEWFGASTDVTAKHEAELALQQASARQLTEARAADSRKARLIAVLAHDLRAPLTAVLGALDLLREWPKREFREHVLKRIERDGHGMLQLIDDVLELALLGAGELKLRPEPFDVSELLGDVAEVIRIPAARKTTDVVIDVARLPLIVCDVMALRRVLVNFATNAVKATNGGTIKISAKIDDISPQNRAVTFFVTDTGEGIAKEDIPKLFRDFGMLDRDNAIDGRGGTGLGLAICRRLAIAMGGDVGVESSLGQGSKFWLRVPLHGEQKLDGEFKNAEIDLKIFSGLRVLVAEDHETIRRITCIQLTKLGASTVEAIDGLDASELAEAEPFDLILMDLHMPRLDGATAASRIRQSGGPSADAWIVAVTAHQVADTTAMMSDLSFDAFMQKPLDLASLSKLLTKHELEIMAPKTDTVFDRKTLNHLREIDGGGLLARSLAGVIREIKETERTLASIISSDDFTLLRQITHRFAGACEVLGAWQLAQELREFEAHAKASNKVALEAKLLDLSDTFSATRLAAEKIVNQLHAKDIE